MRRQPIPPTATTSTTATQGDNGDLNPEQVIAIAQEQAAEQQRVTDTAVRNLQSPELPKPTTTGKPFYMVLREELQYYVGGIRHVLNPGVIMSSQDYNYKHMLSQGAQINLTDEYGEIKGDINAMNAAGAKL